MQEYLLNALPGALIPAQGITLHIEPVDVQGIPTDVASAIGHADTANLVAGALGRPVPCARISVPVLVEGQVHYLALYQGPRLPEGSTTLPEGSTLSFYRLTAQRLGSGW